MINYDFIKDTLIANIKRSFAYEMLEESKKIFEEATKKK